MEQQTEELILSKEEKKAQRTVMVNVSAKLLDILRRHAKGEPVFRDMVARIEAREAARENIS